VATIDQICVQFKRMLALSGELGNLGPLVYAIVHGGTAPCNY